MKTILALFSASISLFCCNSHFLPSSTGPTTEVLEGSVVEAGPISWTAEEFSRVANLKQRVNATLPSKDQEGRETLYRRQEAVESLGRLHFEKRRYREALDYYTMWKPQSSCGTCADSMNGDRVNAILVCRLHLGEQLAVADEWMKSLSSGESTLGNIDILFRLYRESGQTQAFLKFIEQSQAFEKHEQLHYVVRIEKLATNKDIASLIEESDMQKFEWETEIAVEAMLSLYDGDLTPFLGVMRKPRASRTMIQFFGKCRSREALHWLATEARSHDSGSAAIEYLRAMTWHGEAGRRMLTNLGKGREDVFGQLANEFVRYGPRFDLLEHPWPRPVRGSLPIP